MKKLLFVLLLAACDSAERQAASGVVNSVVRFRRADLAGTPAAVDDLRATVCNADSCATKDTCLVAGDLIAQGLKLKAEVEKQIPKAERQELRDPVAIQTMTTRLEQADASIKKGFESLAACDESVLALKRKYRL